MIVLETERLILRDHIPEDHDAYCAMEAEADYRLPPALHTREIIENSFWEWAMVPRRMGLWATIYKPENKYIGRCGIYPYFCDETEEVIPDEGVLAYYIARPYWGRGLATEAGRALIRYGFDVLGLKRLRGGVNAINRRSIRVAEKLGMRHVRSGEEAGNQWYQFEISPDSALTASA